MIDGMEGSLEHRLDNGMDVVAVPVHGSAFACVSVWYAVGGKDDPIGKSGLAHLLEHLMFTGSRHAPGRSFDRIVERWGGRSNATTDEDCTQFVDVGPASLLGTFLWLESDRMATLGEVLDPDVINTERQVVENEIAEMYLGRPYGRADLAVPAAVYPQGHPYARAAVGSVTDLRSIQLSDVLGFWRRHYQPANAGLIMVGAVEPQQAFRLAERYFSWIPSAPRPFRPAPAALGDRRSGRTVEVKDDVLQAKVSCLWPSPALVATGDAELDLAALILAEAAGAPLRCLLSSAGGPAADVTAIQRSRERGGLFEVSATLLPGESAARAGGALVDSLVAGVEALAATGPTEEELDRALRSQQVYLLRELDSLEGKADLLGTFRRVTSQHTDAQWHLDRYLQSSRASVRAALQELVGSAPTVIWTMPQVQVGDTSAPCA